MHVLEVLEVVAGVAGVAIVVASLLRASLLSSATACQNRVASGPELRALGAAQIGCYEEATGRSSLILVGAEAEPRADAGATGRAALMLLSSSSATQATSCTEAPREQGR